MSRPALQIPGLYSGYYPQEFVDYSTAYQNKLEKVGWKWYDTQTYSSGTTTLITNWFNTRATHDLSNMETAFQLPAPKAFLVRAIRFYLKQRPRSTTIAANAQPQTGAFDNIAQLINTGVFTFTIGNKQYDLEPLWVLTAGAGAAGAMTTGNTGGLIDYAQNGISDPRAVNTLPTALFIPPQMNFTAILDWPAALTLAGGDTTITMLLDGDIYRAVQ